MTRRRRLLVDALMLAGALAASVLITDVAQADNAVTFAAGVNVDLNIAALTLAAGTLLAGIVAYLRLRTERPKIVAEVGKLNEERDAKLEERLRTALQSAWDNVDRCNDEIKGLRERERELEDRVEILERVIRDAGLELP